MSNQIDLLLINPGGRAAVYGRLDDSFAAIEPPLWTAILAGYVRSHGFSVKILDADARCLTDEEAALEAKEKNPLLIGVGILGANPSASSTPKMAAARGLLNAIRKENIRAKTFIYGIHPSALPERTLKEESVDFVCKGECFYTVLELLKSIKSGADATENRIAGLYFLKNGKMAGKGYGSIVKNLDDLPFAAWDLLPMDKYRAHNWHCLGSLGQRSPYAVIYTSLGCPFDCNYCNIHALYDGKPGIRFRSPEKVIEEIDILVKAYNVKNIKILDELFVLKEGHVTRLCDLIIARGYDLNIWAYARIDTVNEKMLYKMKHAGVNWLAYGIESASKRVRDGVIKRGFDGAKIESAVRMTRDAGISMIGNFIFGLPDDDLETMRATSDMAKRLNFEYINFYVAMAYPGSALYERALKRGWELPKDWSGYSQLSEDIVPLATKYLSAEEVLRFRDKAFEEYFNDPRYIDMIENRFGKEASAHIKEMMKFKIHRKLLYEEAVNKTR